MVDNLQKYILTTLVYYDVMDYPMTSFEIWKYLTRVNELDTDNEKYSLSQVINKLGDNKLRSIIEEYRGYYFLKGRQELVVQRIERNKIAERKIRIAKRVVFWLRFIPFVRMVAITGRLAMKNTENKSDLDLLVVLKHGRIFTGRLLVTLLVHVIGKRRYGNKIKDRVCLNYFITTKSLEIMLKDMFSASEYSFMVPVFGLKVFKKFRKQNGWIAKYKPNYEFDKIGNLDMVSDSRLAKTVRNIGERLLSFDLLEENLKKWQVKRIMDDPRTKKEGSMIIADSDSLVFLPDPQSPKIFERFQEKLSSLTKN